MAAVTAAVPTISLDLGLPNLSVARIISYYLIPYGFAALIYAPLTRFVSYRRVLIGSMMLFAASNFLSGSATSLNMLLVSRVLMGITAAGAIPLGLMVIGDFFERSVRGRLVGVFFSCSFFSSLAGVIVVGAFDWPWIFYIPAVIGLLLVIALCALRLEILDKTHQAHVSYIKVFEKAQVRNVFLFIFAMSFLYHAVHKWYGVYFSEVYGMDKAAISLFFIISAVGGFFGQLFGGVLSDKRGRVFTCLIGVFGLGVSTVFLYGHYPLLGLAAVILGVSMFWTVGHNGISTVLTDFSDEDRPVVASLNSSVRFISGGLGFALSRFFVEQNFGLTFLYIGILIILLGFIVKRVFLK